jgi:hypothetical protein
MNQPTNTAAQIPQKHRVSHDLRPMHATDGFSLTQIGAGNEPLLSVSAKRSAL